MIVKGGYPDFIVFNGDNYVFIEYKGSHLKDAESSQLKNALGSMLGQGNYYMVYQKEKGSNDYYAIGIVGSEEQLFKPEIHLGIYLNK